MARLIPQSYVLSPDAHKATHYGAGPERTLTFIRMCPFIGDRSHDHAAAVLVCKRRVAWRYSNLHALGSPRFASVRLGSLARQTHGGPSIVDRRRRRDRL